MPAQVSERLSGVGAVLSGDREIATVRYQLVVTQDVLGGPQDRILGQKDVAGSLSLISGAMPWATPTDTVLQLEDGRLLPFFVERHTVSSRSGERCTIVASGSLSEVPHWRARRG